MIIQQKTSKQLHGIFVRVVKSTLISEITIINPHGRDFSSRYFHYFPEKPSIWKRGQTPTGFFVLERRHPDCQVFSRSLRQRNSQCYNIFQLRAAETFAQLLAE